MLNLLKDIETVRTDGAAVLHTLQHQCSLKAANCAAHDTLMRV
jgi:hypothetical protein